MSELSRKTALLLDEAIDGREVTPPSGDDGEILGLLEVVELLRSQPETTLRSVSEASGTRGKWPTRVRAAAVVVLIVGLGAGLLVQRISQAKNDAAAERTAACFNSAHLIGRGVGLVPIGAESYVVNAAREAGDPCPQAPVRWAKESAKAAGFSSVGSSKTAYVFLLKGDFYLNPVGHRHFHRYLAIAWTAKGSSTDYHRIAMPSAAAQLWLRPRRIQTLPWAIARQMRGIGATSPIRYRSLRLALARRATGLSLWPKVSGDRAVYLTRAVAPCGANASASSCPSGEVGDTWIALKRNDRWRIRAIQGGLGRLAEPSSKFWLPPRLPGRLTKATRRQLYDDSFSHHPLTVDWVAATAGHLRSIDPYEEAVSETVPRNAIVILAVEEGKERSGTWTIETRLGASIKWAFYGGDPVDDLPLSDFGRLHAHRIAKPLAPPNGH